MAGGGDVVDLAERRRAAMVLEAVTLQAMDAYLERLAPDQEARMSRAQLETLVRLARRGLGR